jgi:transcription elongation factor Elf1
MTGHKPQATEETTPMANPMDFVAPSQIVELPSKGRYPIGHPLCGRDSIEIRYMTAKDEDVLTNRSMLKKGIAIDRLIQNLIKDPSIDSKTLYIGDRNAIIIHARASAYGEDYKTKVNCPACGETSKFKFDLSNHEVYHGDNIEEANITETENATFIMTLPLSGIQAEIRPLTGRDEMAMVSSGNIKTATDNLITKQIKSFVTSYNGYNDRKTINYVTENMTATDSRYLRDCFQLISPDLVLNDNFECSYCGHEEEMSVPFGADFFWPDR